MSDFIIYYILFRSIWTHLRYGMIKKSSTLFLKPEAVQRTVVQNDWVLHYSSHKQTTPMHFIKTLLVL